MTFTPINLTILTVFDGDRSIHVSTYLWDITQIIYHNSYNVLKVESEKLKVTGFQKNLAIAWLQQNIRSYLILHFKPILKLSPASISGLNPIKS